VHIAIQLFFLFDVSSSEFIMWSSLLTFSSWCQSPCEPSSSVDEKRHFIITS